MKKLIVFSVVLLLLSLHGVYGQNVINVPSNTLNALATAIEGANAGDIFVLERNGFYFNQGRITVAQPITIKAADGDGARPLVQQAPKQDGTYDGEDILIQADLTVQNLHFNGFQTSRTVATGRALRLGVQNIRLVVDGCAFERYWLRTIDFNDQDGCRFFAMNNLHLWDGKDDRIDNGRPIDCRSAGVDTLFLQNNTYLNCNDRIIRHMGADLQPIKYAFVDHNTFYGNIGYRPPFDFNTIETLIFTNNIIANVGMLGTDTLSNRIQEINYTDPRAICIFTITGADTLNTQLVMKYNNVYLEDRVKNLYALNPDSLQIAPLFNKQWEDRIDPAVSHFEEVLTFNNAPSLDSMLLSVENYIKGGTNWSNTGFITYAQVLKPEEVDMSYGTSASSYSAAAAGFPLGDLNWYPDKKAEWEAAGKPTHVEASGDVVPDRFNLYQNYPNPFNPETTINFSLAKKSLVKLQIFSVTGALVETLLDVSQEAGFHTFHWNASQVPSGIYFYKLTADGQSKIRKMILVK